MTQEQRLYISADDLSDVEIICKHEDCGASVACSLQDGLRLPDICPSCSKSWFTLKDNRKADLISFAGSLRDIREVSGAMYEVRFRVHNPNDTK